LDALKHIPKVFWSQFSSAAKSFTMGEMYQNNPGYPSPASHLITTHSNFFSLACPYQQAVDAFFNYPLYAPLYQGFGETTASLAAIPAAWGSLYSANCADPSLLGTFIENHDLSRFWNQTSDPTLGKNAVTYLLLAAGIPFFYSGFETMQAGAYPNYNRDPLWPAKWQKTDMYNFIATINKVRNGVVNKDGDGYVKGGMTFLFSAGNAVAFKRGGVLVFVTNVGSSGADVTIVTSDSGFTKGTEMVDFIAGGSVIVADGGVITVVLKKGMPVVLYPKTEAANVVLSTKVVALEGNSTVANGTSGGAVSGSGTATAAAGSGTSTAKSLATRLTGEKGILQQAFMGLGVAFGAGYLAL
jgi:alpha-amylase